MSFPILPDRRVGSKLNNTTRSMKIKNNLNFCGHGVEEFVLEALTADPTAEIGRKYLRIGSDNHNNRERVFTGGAWRDVAYLDDLENIYLDEFLTKDEWNSFVGTVYTKTEVDSIVSNLSGSVSNLSGRLNSVETWIENPSFSSLSLDSLSAGSISGSWDGDTIPISKGGTGATSKSNARDNLGLSAAATRDVATSVIEGSTALITSGAVYAALEDFNPSVSGLGEAAYCDVDETVSEDSSNLITSGGVFDALSRYVIEDDLGAAAFKGVATNISSGNSSLVTSNLVYNAINNLNFLPSEGADTITTVGTITSGTWSAEVIGIEYGGTGASDAANARTNLGLGTAATKGVTTSVSSGSSSLVTSGAVYTALQGLSPVDLGEAAYYNVATSISSSSDDLVTSALIHDTLDDYALKINLGNAASKGVATSIESGNEDLVTSDAVYNSLQGYVEAGTLGAAAYKAVSDSSSASAISSSSQYLVTERGVYFGLPTINGKHDYNSNTNIYAPTSVGTSGQFLKSSGRGAPSWVDISSINVGSADKLSSPVEIWGRSFDGSGDISGALEGVTTITTSGNATIGGFLFVEGAVYFAGDDTYKVSSGGSATFASLKVQGTSTLRTVVPEDSDTYNLGSSYYYWQCLYSSEGRFASDVNIAGMLSANGGITIPDTETFKIGSVTFTVSGNTVTCDGNFCTTGTNSSLSESE